MAISNLSNEVSRACEPSLAGSTFCFSVSSCASLSKTLPYPFQRSDPLTKAKVTSPLYLSNLDNLWWGLVELWSILSCTACPVMYGHVRPCTDRLIPKLPNLPILPLLHSTQPSSPFFTWHSSSQHIYLNMEYFIRQAVPIHRNRMVWLKGRTGTWWK